MSHDSGKKIHDYCLYDAKNSHIMQIGRDGFNIKLHDIQDANEDIIDHNAKNVIQTDADRIDERMFLFVDDIEINTYN